MTRNSIPSSGTAIAGHRSVVVEELSPSGGGAARSNWQPVDAVRFACGPAFISEPHSAEGIGAAPQRRPWRPSAGILTSCGVHAGALAALVVAPASWPAVLSAVAANHALLAAAGLVPRSRLLGANLLRLPPGAAARGEVALTFDDGPDPQVTPRILDLLEEHDARATFFCVGERANRHAGLCREIVRRGHAVENHTQQHGHRFPFLGLGAFVREIGVAQETLANACGQWPVFFRAPAGLRNPLLDPALALLGLRLAAWTRRGFDTVVRDPRRVAGRLLRGLLPGDILLLHDGGSARTRAGVPVVLEALPLVMDVLAKAGLRSVTLREGAR